MDTDHRQDGEPQASPATAAFENNAFAGLLPALQKALTKSGYKQPTPIQEQAIPSLLEGRDAIGIAQTGTGKTAAFTLPLLHRLASDPKRPESCEPRALILAPTRELAVQIADSCKTYGQHLRITGTLVYGGVSQYHQVRDLRRGIDILVATPGRLLDLMNQGHIRLDSVEVFILDEVDRMLDMGFIDDIRQIVAEMPAERQTMFFSATMPPKIESLARSLVTKPVRIEIEAAKVDMDRIQQKVLFVKHREKTNLLLDKMESDELGKVLVFTQRKVAADEVSEALWQAGIKSTAIHGDKNQFARTKALEGFKRNRFQVLVATDVAARGLDVDDITHVINFDLPLDAETYMHRIGRTGRAGATGEAISFCSAGDRNYLRAIQSLLGNAIPADLEHDYHCDRTHQASQPGPSRGYGKGGGRKGRFGKPGENKPWNKKSGGSRSPWNKKAGGRPWENKAVDLKPWERKPSENKAVEQKPWEKKKADQKPWEKKAKNQPVQTTYKGKGRPGFGDAPAKPASAKGRPRIKRKPAHKNKPWEAMHQ